jgi:uracil-DNA glycosylase family 4
MGKRDSSRLEAWETTNREIVDCHRCARLREHCRQVAVEKRAAFRGETYWGRPVPNFGDPAARLLIVGLAPAAHGANRTGRMFTGDRSGEWLYRALHKAGFASQPQSISRDDALRLHDCAITAAVHCAPPGNKPLPRELANCNPWLERTIDLLPVKVVLALGQLAWRASVVEARRRSWHLGGVPKFGHAAQVRFASGHWLLGSYHPSQQNTFTGVLTERMFDAVFRTARRLLDG